MSKWTEAEKKYEGGGEKKLKRRRTNCSTRASVAHDGSNFFDLGELGIELALVLCSVAMLAKSRMLWIVGIVIGTLGFAVAMCGFFSEPILDVLHQIGIVRM